MLAVAALRAAVGLLATAGQARWRQGTGQLSELSPAELAVLTALAPPGFALQEFAAALKLIDCSVPYDSTLCFFPDTLENNYNHNTIVGFGIRLRG